MDTEEIKIITLGDIFRNLETEKQAFEFLKYIKNLPQENKQLKERIEYLERSNNRREDTIIEQRQKISDLEDDWNKLKEIIDKAREYIECHKYTIKHYEPYETPTGLPNYETYNIKGYYQLLDILKEES